VSNAHGLDVLAKPLSTRDVLMVLFNENSAVGKTDAASYTLTGLWAGGTRTTTGSISASVPGHGVVMNRVSSVR
jgi:alpha-galactosidase